MGVHAENLWTVESYLAAERQGEKKHEFLDGERYAMSGASRSHNKLVWNLVSALDPQLKARGCEGYASDMRVHIPATGLYTYPDLAIVCGEPEFLDQEFDTLLNPTWLIEVLSPSTADYDRGRKFLHYRTIPTIQAYLLVAQDEIRAELFLRQPANRWLLSELTRREAVLDLSASKMDFQLPLEDIYRGLDLAS